MLNLAKECRNRWLVCSHHILYYQTLLVLIFTHFFIFVQKEHRRAINIRPCYSSTTRELIMALIHEVSHSSTNILCNTVCPKFSRRKQLLSMTKGPSFSALLLNATFRKTACTSDTINSLHNLSEHASQPLLRSQGRWSGQSRQSKLIRYFSVARLYLCSLQCHVAVHFYKNGERF